MRVIAALLILGMSLAFIPASQAEPVPPGPCPTKSIVDGAVHVYTTIGCGVRVDVGGNVHCFFGGHWTTVADTGQVAVRVWTCGPEVADPMASSALAPEVPALTDTSGFSCTCDPNPLLLLVVYLLQQGPCAADAAAYDIYHSYDVNRVDGDCIIDVHPAYECVGGWGHDEHVNVGPLRLTVRVCTGGPFPPPVVGALPDPRDLLA